MVELKPCQFCGEGEFLRTAADSIGAMAVICHRCGAAGPPCAEAFGVGTINASKEAQRLWNTRPSLSDEDVERVARAIGEAERMACGGYPFTGDDPRFNPWLTDKHRDFANAALAALHISTDSGVG